MYKVFGVVITLLLVFSMVAAFSTSTTPVAAGTQKWSQINLPTDVKGQVLPGSDVSTIAVTPDGKTLFAGVLNNSLWGLWKSTDGGYKWMQQSGYNALNASVEEIVAIKFSPDFANDGKIYVATSYEYDGFVYMSKDSGKTWKDTGHPTDYFFFPISSMDVTLDSEGVVTVVVGDWYDAYLYSDGTWTPQNAGGWVQAVAFSPDYATDGTVVAVVRDGTSLRLRAETEISANLWNNYVKDAYFSYTNSTGIRSAIPAVTACIAFPSDYATTQTVFVGLNSQNNRSTVGMDSCLLSMGDDTAGPQHQLGDAFKVSLVGGVATTSTVTDLNIRGQNTGTDVWSMAVSGDTGNAYIICGLRYASQSGGMENWQAQVHLSINGGEGWSISMKPPSGMIADISNIEIGMAAPVVVMAPDFDNSSTVYCANGYYSNGGVALSGFYVSTNKGATWNGRGLLDRTVGAITDIAPSAQYDNDSTIYMVTQDTETIVMSVNVGLLWKTVDGGAHWDIICDMVPLATITSQLQAVYVDQVAVAGDAVFITGSQGALGNLTCNPLYLPLIFRSTDAGKMFGTIISARGPVEHLLAIDQDTLITANGSTVYKTTNGGAKWTLPSPDTNEILATENISDMVINGNTILVGTDQGRVYICDDYATDFSFVQVGTKSVGNAATSGAVVVAFGTNYGTDKTIYAGVTGSNSGIWRNVEGADTWDQLTFNVSSSMPTNYATTGNISALACDQNGILWAICTAQNTSVNASASDTYGIPVRSVNPTESTVSKVNFNSVTTGLTSALSCNLNVVGSTNTLAVGGALNNELWIYTDTLVKVTLVSPTNGATAAGDLLKGTSFARVVLSWTYLAKADSYQYQVALDPDFNNIVSDSTGVLVNGTIPGTSLDVQLYAGTKYYWRVRVATGINSQWSDVWSFTTPLGPSAEAPALLGPTAGQQSVSLLPVLQWSGLASATQYELQLAKNCDFSGSNLIVDKTQSNALGAVTAYQLTQSLTAGTNYCWRVRAKSDLSTSAWSNTNTFTTAPTPVPAKEESTPVWVWVVIALSAVLLVSVVILIIRTRRA